MLDPLLHRKNRRPLKTMTICGLPFEPARTKKKKTRNNEFREQRKSEHKKTKTRTWIESNTKRLRKTRAQAAGAPPLNNIACRSGKSDRVRQGAPFRCSSVRQYDPRRSGGQKVAPPASRDFRTVYTPRNNSRQPELAPPDETKRSLQSSCEGQAIKGS
ncbi:unnamed protein product, partial [Ectocarpus sp. 4 AP-2014]